MEHSPRPLHPTPAARPARRRPLARSAGVRTVRVVLAVGLLLSCDETVTNVVPVATVRVLPPESEIDVGAAVQLTADPLDANGNRLSGRTVTWSSADESVALVSAGGMATGAGAGQTMIRATVDGRSGEASVVVRAPATIVVDPTSVAFVTATGADPAPEQVLISNGGDAPLAGLRAAATYEGSASGWLSLSLDREEAPAQLTVVARAGSLGPGSYSAVVTVTAAEAANSPVTLDVTLQVTQGAPAAPSGLAVTAATATTITLGWSDNSSDESEFSIERRQGSAAFAEVATVGPGVTTYRDTGLDSEESFDYRVRACNTVGCSSFTDVVTGTTSTLPLPAPPSGLAATDVSATAIVLVWTDNSGNETGFEIERRAPGSSGFTLLHTAAANAETYTDGTVRVDGTYSYRVRACGSSGCSPYTAVIDATTQPVPVTDVVATAASHTSIDVSWTDNSATETTVRVERRTGGGSFAQVTQLGADATSLTDTGLTPSTTYGYRIRACNSGGCSSYSSEATATTQASPPPANPSGLAATLAADESDVTVTWTDNSGNETSFRLQRSVDGGAFAPLASVNADVQSYTDTGVGPDHAYTYRVEACGDSGCSGFGSEEATVLTTPVPPTGLTATTASASRIDLAWTDGVNTEDEFRIQRSVNGGTFSQLAATAANATSHADATTAADNIYTYRVLACNATGCSAASTTASDTTPPVAPTGLTATAVSPSQINLVWNDPSTTELQFQVQRRTGSAAFTQITVKPAGDTVYMNTGLSPATAYDYRVLACNTSGCSPASNVATATTQQLPPPPAPASLTAGILTSPLRVSLSWPDVTTESGYEIERAETGTSFSPLATPAANATSYTDGSVARDRAYAFRIRACNAGGCSSFVSTTITTPPGATTGLAPGTVTATTVDLTWTDGHSTETSFELERDSGSGFTQIAVLGADVTAFTDTGLTSATLYGYRIRACNSGGCGAYSTPISVTTN